MTPIAEAVALTVKIGAKRLLDDVSVAIRPGETVALVGPNGAGKSTLLRALSGELTPSAGMVRLRNRDPRAYRPSELALHRAVLSQTISVAFPFSVADIVRMGAGEQRGPRTESLVDAALAQVRLDDFRDRIIGTLSGGEQQRAHFARILVQVACGERVHGPGLMLLDEPTASLDLRHQLDLIEATRRCAERGVATVAVFHDLNLAVLFAHRVVVLGNGRVAIDGVSHQAINDDVLRSAFGVTNAVGQIPNGGAPFVLPHSARRSPEA